MMKNMEAEYDNSGRVENSSKLLSDYIEHSAEFRSRSAKFADFDQSYGPNIRNKLDLFWPGNSEPDKTAPIIMFIHGGYWQRLDRAAFSHMAKGLNAKGIAVAIPSYTLCPDINVSGIIDEIRRACIVLWKTYDRNITVCGHSAGGHLAACMLATNWNRIHNSLPINLVESALSISGVFDLAPLLETSHNNALKLTKEEAKTASPYNWIIEHDLRFDAWVGENESSEFIRQSSSQAQRWRMMGANTRYHEIPGANHFTAIAPLTDANSLLVKRLLELMQPVQATTLDNLNIPAHNPLPANPQTANKTMPPATAQKTETRTRPPVSKSPVMLSPSTSPPPISPPPTSPPPISRPPSTQSEQKQEPPKVIIPEVQAKTMPPVQAPVPAPAPAPAPEVKSEAKVSDYKQASTPAPPAEKPSISNPAAGIQIIKAGIAPKKAEVVKPAPEKIASKPKPDTVNTPQNKADAEIKKPDAETKPDTTQKVEPKAAPPREAKAEPRTEPKSDLKTETKAATASKTPPLPEKTAKPTTEVKPKSSQENAPKTETKKAPKPEPEPKAETAPKTVSAPEAQPDTKDQSAKNEAPKKPVDQNINFDGPAKDSDNFTLISNIDGRVQNRLNELGFSTFMQIAELSQTQQEMIEDILGFDGQITQEHWITQARHLIARKQLASKKL